MDLSVETDCGAHEQCDCDSSDNSMDIIVPDMTIVLFGSSSSVQFGHENLLLGEEQTHMENAEVSRIDPLQKKISEHHISVFNMIDLHEAELCLDCVDHHIGQLVNENEIHVFIFVVRLGRLTNDDKMGLEWLQRVFGDKVLQFVMILFTYEREEECNTIKDDLKRNPDLQQLLEKCGGRYQTCNKMMNNQSEMSLLMKKIERLFNENQQQSYTGEMFNTASIRRKKLETNEHQCSHTSGMEPNAQLNLILLGEKRAGKSASGNTILGREAFISRRRSGSVTPDNTVESGTIDGFPVTVYDTPGFCDPELSEDEIQQIVRNVQQKCESGHCVFLLVIKADSFTEEERKTVEKIEELLGEKHIKNTWILFTRGDELQDENMTIQEFLNRNKGLKRLIEKYDQRYHVFNNKKRGASDQARLLLINILQRSLGVKDGGRLTRQFPDSTIKAHNELDAPVSGLSSRRIVLLGKTGVGKSATGNTILGQKEFRSVMKMSSVTCECSEKHATVSGRSVSVVDTPGFFDTQLKPEELMIEIARSVYLSSPGPHAFLIVLRANDRFTEHEQQIPQQIEMVFGQEVLKYSIILFTHGDLLKGQNIESLTEENCQLRHLLDQCGGRFHVFNNENQNNREQVNKLLQKIDTMIEQNGGGHYSNQMFEDAHRFRRETEERRQREKEERKQEKQITYSERVRKETQRRDGIREEMEAKRSELERLKAERKRKRKEEERKQEEKQRQEMERMKKETVKESEAHENFNLERRSENPEFKRFLRKYWSKWYIAAFTLGHVVTGEYIGGIIGGTLGFIGGTLGFIGGTLGFIGGPLGVLAGALAGVTVGTSVGAFVSKIRLKLANNSRRSKP